MKYRKLGSTGLEVSEIGFGAWGIGGLTEGATSYGPTDDDESRRALEQAFDQGITLYDTSDIYGYGHSESVLGQVFKSRRQQVIFASKVGFLEHNGMQDFSSERMKQSLDSTLARLQTDYLDLYQLHSPAIGTIVSDRGIVDTLEELRDEGKIRAYGISLQSPDDGLAAINDFGFKSIQVNLNLVDQRAVTCGLLDLSARQDVGIICRTPLCFGLLSGRYAVDTKFDQRDHRSVWHPDQIKTWAGAWELFSEALEKQENQTPAQAALRFCLSCESVASVIPGMLTVSEVSENAAVSRLGPLMPHELQIIKNVYANNEFFLAGLRQATS